MQLPNGQMQLVQPMMRPAMAIAAPHPHPALMGGNLIRTPGAIPGMPAGKFLFLTFGYVFCFPFLITKLIFKKLSYDS